jgi:flagellar FliJ protein
MDSDAELIHLKETQIEGRRRKVSQIQVMIAEFELLAAELGREIGTEEDRTGNHDPAHFAYSTYAKAAMRRRDNLKLSTEELRGQLSAARNALNDAIAEFVSLAGVHDRMQPGIAGLAPGQVGQVHVDLAS